MSLEQIAIEKRRQRLQAFISLIEQKRIPQLKEFILADFGWRTGLTHEKVESYCRQAVKSNRLFEKPINSQLLIGTQDQWTEYEKQQTEAESSESKSLRKLNDLEKSS